jgi:RND family efflux transporter MFP subunit
MASAHQTAEARRLRNARRRRRFLTTATALALIAVSGWYGWTRLRAGSGESSKVITAPVTRGDLVETVSATGSVTAQTGAQVKIGTQITGRIRRLYADVGSFVQANQVIAELDLPDIEAQARRAEADLEAARARLQQQIAGLDLLRVQTEGAITQAKADLRRAQARLEAAQANANLQAAQTPTSVRRAETALAAAKAALSTARSNLKQVEAGAKLQTATAQEQLTQAQATAANSALNLKRNQELLAKGFVAASVVDAALAADQVNQSQVNAARQNAQLVQERVAADVQAARDQVTQAQESVTAAQADLEAARAGTYQDRARLADVNDARAQVRQAEAALAIAERGRVQLTLREQDIQQARQAVRAAEAQAQIAHTQYERAFIRSPIAGTVLQLATQQGETLAAGLSAPTLIIVADLKRLQVDVFVDETDIGKIKLGQQVQVTVDAFPKNGFKGVVKKIASGSTIQQGVITYGVTVAIDKVDLPLKPDMTASVTIQTGKREDVLLVPSEAVKVGVRGSTVRVAVKGKDGKETLERRDVKTGASDGVQTEITEGLKEGEIVVLAGGDEERRGGGNRPGGGSPFGPQPRRGGGGRG